MTPGQNEGGGSSQGFNCDTVYVAGNGNGGWLNGVNWDPSCEANLMTEILSGVWEIEFQDVSDDHWAFKFAIDGSWSYNFGVKSNSGAEND